MARHCRSHHMLDWLLGMHYTSYCLSHTRVEYGLARERSFIVVEDAGVKCDDKGGFVLALLFKRGIDTLGALRVLARVLGLRVGQIGVAGLKDADATTIQYVTLPLTSSVSRVLEKECCLRPLPNIVLRPLCRTRTFLRPGRLRGNTFTLLLRAADPGVVEELVEAASKQPLLNYYGYQRFGTTRPNTHVTGLLMAHGSPRTVHEALYTVYPDESETIARCRLARWRCSLTGGKWYEATLAVEKLLHRVHEKLWSILGRLAYSALQAYMFNLYLSKRVEEGYGPGDVLEGERVAENGFPMAPVPGRGLQIRGEARRILYTALLDHGLAPSLVSLLPVRGYWRPLYTRPEGLSIEHVGGYTVLRFRLEKGSYATLVLREIASNPLEIT